MFVLFQHQHTSALTQYEAVTVHVPRTRGCFRIVVTGGQSTHGGKTANAQRGHGGFGTAGNHHISVAILDQASSVTNGVQTGCTCRHNSVARTFQAQADGQLSRHQVDQGARHKERGNPTWAPFQIIFLGFFNAGQTTNPRTDDNAHTLSIDAVDIQTAILPGLHTCHHAVMDKGIHLLGFFGRNVWC